MLEELLKYESFASKNDLLFLLFDALRISDGQSVSVFRKYCTSNRFSIGASFDGTLRLLEFMGLIKVANRTVHVQANIFDPAKTEPSQHYLEGGGFVEALLQSFKRDCSIGDFIKRDAIKWDADRKLFYLKEALIPIRFLGIRNLLLSLGFLERDSILQTGNLFVTSVSTPIFEALVLDSLRESKPDGTISLSDLVSKLDKQGQLGKEAEVFVVAYEQRRLQDHPRVSSIRMVSEEHANAGFDVESFNDRESVFVDRYIEVKSYASDIGFYWSRNEVEMAKVFGEKYYLYLVDRDRMSVPGYDPKMLQNPYQKVFLSEFWEHSPETWRMGPRTEKGEVGES